MFYVEQHVSYSLLTDNQLACRYLPSDASFLTANADNQPLTDKKTNSISRALWRNFTVNKLSCLAMFTFLACITERKSISSDPLNFNIFSIVFEIIRQVHILFFCLPITETMATSKLHHWKSELPSMITKNHWTSIIKFARTYQIYDLSFFFLFWLLTSKQK